MTPDEIQYKILPYIIGIAIFLIFRAYLISRLLRLVKPLAAEMGSLGAELLEAHDVNHKAKKVVSAVCKRPVSPLFMWLATLLYIPLSIAGSVKKFADPTDSMGLDSKQKFGRIVTYHFLLNAARSPFLFLILTLQILIMLALVKQPLRILLKWTYWTTSSRTFLSFPKTQDC